MLSDKWIQHQRKQNRATLQQWKCCLCSAPTTFSTMEALKSHFERKHVYEMEEVREDFREYYYQACSQKLNRDTSRRPFIPNIERTKLEMPRAPPEKRTLPTRTISAVESSQTSSPHGRSDLSNENQTDARAASKRVVKTERVSTTSPHSQKQDTESSPPQKTKTHPESDIKLDSPGPRRSVGNKSIWVEGDLAPTRSSVDQSNIASVAIAKKRNQQLQHNSRLPAQTSPQVNNSKVSVPSKVSNSENPRPAVIRNMATTILQPPAILLSHGQLCREIKGIYITLVKVEAECIEVDKKPVSLGKDALISQAAIEPELKLNHSKVHALISLHRSLLDEYHDFLRTSHHPLACADLRGLASKYALPARIWNYGIHSFLEVLRSLLPDSLDHMLDFIYLSYSMMALFYETVKEFEEIWIECLGDLGRYRMAIETDLRDKEIWSNVARHWYIKALDKSPATGRLYHHLAILARPSALEQLFWYSKSLCVSTPFLSTRTSILTLFEPVLKMDKESECRRIISLDNTFVMLHAIIFTNQNLDIFSRTTAEFLRLLKIAVQKPSFLELGSYVALINCFAFLEYGSSNSTIMKFITPPDDKDLNKDIDEEIKNTSTIPIQAWTELKHPWNLFEQVQRLVYSTIETVLKKAEEKINFLPNILPFIHVFLVFMLQMTNYPPATNYINDSIPWDLLTTMFNELLKINGNSNQIFDDSFPIPDRKDFRAFPEDFALRGLTWTANFFPDEWFRDEKIDQEEKYREGLYMAQQRQDRILWLAHRIAMSEMTPLVFSKSDFIFSHGGPQGAYIHKRAQFRRRQKPKSPTEQNEI
ncbi:hypothetical protein K3495_g10171 [Podosphaera aphanis]|nr:hypothetical protein K3495_g10171 [Podosphaera aphanis]